MRDQQDKGSNKRFQPMPARAIWVGWGAAVGLAVAVIMLLLFAPFFGPSPEGRTHVQAIGTAGSLVVGTGGAAALLLAARKQRSTELDLQQKDQIAADNRHDAEERRVTELYTAAAQQLGSEKPAVSLAGLYALERLGQHNPTHRQTIVNLFCAYLRMPPTATVPDESSASPNNQPLVTDGAYLQHEREVRRTAQRLLIEHLHPDYDKNGRPTNPEYWPEMDLDLAGALLHEWNFGQCHVRNAQFTGAHFRDTAWFDQTRFDGSARFVDAHFHGEACFTAAQFHGHAQFADAHFHSKTSFCENPPKRTPLPGAYFHGPATFNTTQFHDSAEFTGAWARLDPALQIETTPPPGYTMREVGRSGQWGQLVPVGEATAVAEEAADA